LHFSGIRYLDTAKGMLETLRDIEGTLRGLDRGRIKIQ